MVLPILSICMPTYNFGTFIGETLQSIVTQERLHETEIVILDGNSTDNTRQVVEGFQKQYPQIKYFRMPEKGGIDRDMAKSVEFATGDYCWLFSSDDIMHKGALSFVLRQITEDHDVFLCKHLECTADMAPRYEYPVLDVSGPTLFDLGDPSARLKYFSLASNTEAFFSFMSSSIVKRSVWNAVPFNDDFATSCWAHVARMLEIIKKQGLRIKYLATPLLSRRGDNDSFGHGGKVRRYALTIDGYHRLADTFFGHDSREAFYIRRAVTKEFRFMAFLSLKILCRAQPDKEDIKQLDGLVDKAYSDITPDRYIALFLYRAFPLSLYQYLRDFYKKGRDIIRSRRRSPA